MNYGLCVRASTLSNWALVIIGLITSILAIITLIFIKRQTDTASQVATATQKSVGALMNGDRAWVAAYMDPVPEIPPEQNYRMVCHLKNVGKTPAFVVESGRTYQIINKGARLADVPLYNDSELCRWQGRGAVLPPEGTLSIVVGYLIGCGDAEMLNIYKGDQTLWVRGFVKYRDVYGADGALHETKYCFRYYPRIGGKDPATVGFVPEGPLESNGAT